jgi:hypothetical protein
MRVAIPLQVPILEVERLVTVASSLPCHHCGGEPPRLECFPLQPALAWIVAARPSTHANVERDRLDPVVPEVLQRLLAVFRLVAAGIFGGQALGGIGGVSLSAQLIGTALGVVWALVGGFVVYGALKFFVGLRMSQEEEFDGADLSTHKISASPERESNW